ncbi:hypothetical protein [Actinoplanes sp. M2I2]|uniref:hypothetical protein n=1 Tax=Actinoplanes sp. M2I2 TaxID=1734444 RepID=UPI00201FDAD3|nr:hypothetical protein [Actinoplanes sp. M2I2]
MTGYGFAMASRTTPESVEAPADDAALFRVSRVLSVVRMFGIIWLIYLVTQPLVRLALGVDRDPWAVLLLQGAIWSALAAVGMAFWPRSPFHTWVRISGAGLELSAAGSDPILLLWPDVASVEVKRQGLRSILRVTPVEMSRVQRADVHHGLPRIRDGAFTVDIGLLQPGVDVLRRAVAAHTAHA